MKFHKRGLLLRSWGAILCAIILVPGDTALSLVAQTPPRPIFASTARFDVASVLPNPPANNSTQTAAELAELHLLQDTRSPAQVAHARHDEVELDIFIFRDVLGEKFTRQALPLTALLSDHLYRDESIIVARAKRYFHRPRPYDFDPTVRPVCRTNRSATSYAYPSGHGTTGYLEALILTMIVPEKSDALLARADD
jgi:acid phosphatase (class A)